MRKLFFFFAATLLFSSSSFSQFYLGAKGGVSIPNLTAGGGNPVSSGWSSRLGPYFGAVGEYDLSKHFSLQVELNYSSQGGKKDGVQAIPSNEFSSFFPPGTPPSLIPAYLYATFKSVAKLNYLELPVLAKYNFPLNKKLAFFVNVGPYIDYLANAKDINTGSGYVYSDEAEESQNRVSPTSESFDSTQDITSQIHRFNVGVQGAIGLELQAGKGKFILSAGGNYGFINIQKYAADGKNDTGAATVTLGYLFKI
jgi:hypothetical protein